jgi:DNA-binding transcriptional regulator YdaS (Cro superfamily)
MLALAHHLERAIHAGRVADRAALARELGLTRARISQLLALLLLAPDIQEAILFAEAIDGREPISMRALRPLTTLDTWSEQRRAWRTLSSKAGLSQPTGHLTAS